LVVFGRSVGFCGSFGSGILRRRLGLNPSLIDAGVPPELTGDLDWVDASLLPPGLTSAGEALCVRPSLIKQSGGQPRGVSPINGFYVISPEMLD
jgi:hypothetical protein